MDYDLQSVSGCVHRLHEAMIVVFRGVTDACFRAHQGRTKRDEARLKSFNHTVGHELKNPISSIHGAASLLLEDNVGDDPKRRAHYVSMVKRNAERASSLVTDLLAITSGEQVGHAEDNGIGIPADARERVFERFYRANAVRPIPGSGLGLSIVHQTVTRWQGKVGFGSAIGAGTSLWFTLPVSA